jgi:iron complex outermembrane receptor protein
MDAQNVVKLDDVLKNVAGVMPRGYPDGWDYYRIRGFDASSTPTLMVLAVAMASWKDLGSGVGRGAEGPYSGAVRTERPRLPHHIVIRKPVPDRFAHVQLTAGSSNFLDPAIDFRGSLSCSHMPTARLAALYHSVDSYVNHAYRHRYYFAPSLTWKPAASTSLTFICRVQRDNGRNGMPLPTLGTAQPNINGPLSISTYDLELDANANKLAQANQQFEYQFRHSINELVFLRQNARFCLVSTGLEPHLLSFLSRRRPAHPLPLPPSPGTASGKTMRSTPASKPTAASGRWSTNAMLGVDFSAIQYRSWLLYRLLRSVPVRTF